MVMVYVNDVDSDVGSLTVARQLPLASGSDAAMAEVPPTLWLPLGQLTSIVRQVALDQTTGPPVAPAPVNPKELERCCGGWIPPWDCMRSDGCATVGTVVVVVGNVVVVVVA